MDPQEQCRQEDGEPSKRRGMEDWVTRSWDLLRGVLTAYLAVDSCGQQHETLAVGARVFVVIGDTTVKILCRDRNRR